MRHNPWNSRLDTPLMLTHIPADALARQMRDLTHIAPITGGRSYGSDIRAKIAWPVAVQRIKLKFYKAL